MPDNSNNEQSGYTTKLKGDPVTKEKLAILRRLTATIAHDIRNPLGTINTSVFSIRVAIEKNQPERIKKALKLAERNIKRCDHILSEFLKITQKVEINRKPVNIDTWIEGLLEEITFPQHIELLHDLNCNNTFPVDPEQLHRALANIITNAIQAMKDDDSPGNKLTVQTNMIEENMVIRVSDTGIGIPVDVLGKIYEPLFSTKRFGVGLGLTVAREIIEKHKGTISVESKAGSGTKVTIKIPAIP